MNFGYDPGNQSEFTALILAACSTPGRALNQSEGAGPSPRSLIKICRSLVNMTTAIFAISHIGRPIGELHPQQGQLFFGGFQPGDPILEPILATYFYIFMVSNAEHYTMRKQVLRHKLRFRL